MPSRTLNCAIDLRARRTFGFWPAIVRELLGGGVEDLESCLASPTPMFSVIFSSRGACIGVV